MCRITTSLHPTKKGRHVSVQVKASRSTSWQFGDITHYCDIAFKDQKQTVGKPKVCPVRGLMVVFVKIEEDGNDRFYILPWLKLRDLLVKGHTAYLNHHKGVRPKRWESLHSAIAEKSLKPYLNKWSAIEKKLK